MRLGLCDAGIKSEPFKACGHVWRQGSLDMYRHATQLPQMHNNGTRQGSAPPPPPKKKATHIDGSHERTSSGGISSEMQCRCSLVSDRAATFHLSSLLQTKINPECRRG